MIHRADILCVFTLLILAGCRSATVSQPLTQTLAGNDTDTQLEFWHTLSERSVPSNDDAFHAMLLFWDGKVDAPDYAGRVAVLKSRGWLAADFNEPADIAVRRGTVAVVLFNALQIKGGLTIRVFGVSPRYAVRELQHVGLYPPSDPHQTFSGGQFVALIGRVEDYRRVKELE